MRLASSDRGGQEALTVLVPTLDSMESEDRKTEVKNEREKIRSGRPVEGVLSSDHPMGGGLQEDVRQLFL